MAKGSILACLALLTSICMALPTLVLQEPGSLEQYSSLVQVLKNSVDEVVFKDIDADASLELYDLNDDIKYDNLLILPNRMKSLAANVDQNTLIKYTENGGNLMIISDNSGTQLDEVLFLNQLGIYPAPKDFKYVDYHEFQSLPIVTPNVVSSIGQIDNMSPETDSLCLLSNSELLFPIIQTSKTSFSLNPSKDDAPSNESTWHSGSQGFFAVAFQGIQNNVRVSWTGLVSNLRDGETFNLGLAEDLVQWTFQKKSVIKATVFKHKRIDASSGLEIPFVDADDYYKVKDQVFFEIGMSEYDPSAKKWVPFIVPQDDNLQLEFIMLDPYQRLNLQLSQTLDTEAIYSTTFQVPDQHGMFTFKVDYKRPGFSFVTEESVVPVRHLANDEYPRSWEILNSYVYLTGYGVVVVAWLIFVILFVISGKIDDSIKKNQ